jgi:perosamine synthetase
MTIKKGFSLGNSKFVPVSKPAISPEDKAAVVAALEAGWVSGEGPIVSEFENSLTRTFKKKFAISCNSGTAAIDLTIAALGLGPSDRVICPSFTIGSCCFELARRGVRIDFIDSEMETFNPTEEAYLDAIRDDTTAILIPHIYGFCVDVPKIKQRLNGRKISIIEDCAESQFMYYPSGGLVGSVADIVTFSFYANKTVVAGEGGAVLCDDAVISQRLSQYRNLCFDADRRFVHTDLGWNYRLSSLNAALANSQLKRGALNHKKKVGIGVKYYMGLRDVVDIYLPPPVIGQRVNGYWIVPIVLKNSNREERDRFANYLKNKGIGNRPFFAPLHLQKVFGSNVEKNSLVNCELLGDTGLYVPSFIGISDDEIDFVINTVRLYFV